MNFVTGLAAGIGAGFAIGMIVGRATTLRELATRLRELQATVRDAQGNAVDLGSLMPIGARGSEVQVRATLFALKLGLIVALLLAVVVLYLR